MPFSLLVAVGFRFFEDIPTRQVSDSCRACQGTRWDDSAGLTDVRPLSEYPHYCYPSTYVSRFSADGPEKAKKTLRVWGVTSTILGRKLQDVPIKLTKYGINTKVPEALLVVVVPIFLTALLKKISSVTVFNSRHPSYPFYFFFSFLGFPSRLLIACSLMLCKTPYLYSDMIFASGP